VSRLCTVGLDSKKETWVTWLHFNRLALRRQRSQVRILSGAPQNQSLRLDPSHKCPGRGRMLTKSPVCGEEFRENRAEGRERRGESLLDDFSISEIWIESRPESGCVSAETGSKLRPTSAGQRSGARFTISSASCLMLPGRAATSTDRSLPRTHALVDANGCCVVPAATRLQCVGEPPGARGKEGSVLIDCMTCRHTGTPRGPGRSP
jgi:hypothetical protein